MLAVMPKRRGRPGVALVTESDYLPVLTQLLDSAREGVDVMAYSFTMGDASGRLDYSGAPFKVAQQLKRLRTERGLRIRVYLESQREVAARNEVTIDHLTRAGIEVVRGTTHAKAVVVDARYVLFGSTNLTSQSMLRNNETNLLFDNAKLGAEAKRYFEHRWRGGAHGTFRARGPWRTDGAFLRPLLKMINTAEKRLEFSIYYFHHPEIEAALIKAGRRGVRVTGFLNHHRSFALDFVRRNQATVRRLRAAGLDDLHFDGGRDFTHSKYLIRDRRELLLGTGNWVEEDVTVHPQLYVQLDDSKLALTLGRHLAQQISSC